MKMIGIIDEFGIENFIPLESNYKQAFLFFIRAKINIQRSAVFFCLDFTDKEISKIRSLVESHKVSSFNDAGIIVIEKLNSSGNKRNTKTEKLLNRFYKLRDRLRKEK